MAAKNSPASSTTLRQTSKTSSSDSAKGKRARTKHACDECRRSQKKCDGDKPLCRRCYLNGTHCTYTPHKSRNQCLCTGQAEDVRADASIPDVFIFTDSSLSSFHTWSATSSPDQSPSTSGSVLEIPSPTNISQDDRLGTAQNTVLELPATPYESEIAPAPVMLQRSRHLYSHRSYSLPSFTSSSSVLPPPHATEFSSFPVCSSLPHNFADEISAELGTDFSTSSDLNEAVVGISVGDLSRYNGLRSRNQELAQRSAEHGTFFDTSSRYNQQALDVHLNQRQASLFTSEIASLDSSRHPMYDVGHYATDRCAQDSSDAIAPSLHMGCTSNADTTSVSYTHLLTQGYANGVSSTSSYVRAAADTQAASRSFQYNGGINADASLGSQARSASEGFVGTRRVNAHDLTSFPSSGSRQNPGMVLLNLPSPRFSCSQWGSDSLSPLLTASYPSSANPSPSVYGVNDFYAWSQ